MRSVPAYLYALAALSLVGSAHLVPHAASSPSNVRARASGHVVAASPQDLTATLESVRQTATAVRLATSGTVTAHAATLTAEATASAPVTATPTPTLGPEWMLDALCRCHVPPLDPASPECAELKARAAAEIYRALATQTALARGTDTPTAPPTDTPTATPVTPTRTATPLPTDEPTPSPAPTWTARVVVVTATPRPTWRAWLPFAILRRSRR